MFDVPKRSKLMILSSKKQKGCTVLITLYGMASLVDMIVTILAMILSINNMTFPS